MARKEPPLDQALAVVIDVVTRVSPYRWYTLRMDLDSLFQYPHDCGFVLGDMLDRLERSPELKGSPLPERALAVVIDAITSLPVERWISLRAQLDKVAQYPHKRDAVLKVMLCQLTRRVVPLRLQIIRGGGQPTAPCDPALRGVPTRLQVIQGGRAPS